MTAPAPEVPGTLEGEVRASDGARLVWRSWEPRSPRAGLLIVHGIGEHGGRYAGLGTRLASFGIRAVAFDHRGHGRSTGPRGHVARWGRYLSDVDEVLRELLPRERPPRYILGHSMGALICLSLAIDGYGPRAGLAGWIVSGAGIRPTGVAKPHLVAIAKLLSHVAPRLTLDLGIAASSLSHDPEVVRRYDADPSIVRRVSARWGSEALRALDAIRARAGRIADDMLILHGEADPLSEVEGSRWLHQRVAGDAELIVYPGALHEPHNDPGCGDVAADVARWIEARASGGP